MSGESNGERGVEEWMEEAADLLATLIGKRVAGVALSPDSVELVFDDCTVLGVKGGPEALVEVDTLNDFECGCLRRCIEAYGIAREETQECMEKCLEGGGGGQKL